MKRILSLILVSIMLLTMLISCGNEVNTDTDSQIIDTEADTNTDTNTDTSTDTSTDTNNKDNLVDANGHNVDVTLVDTKGNYYTKVNYYEVSEPNVLPDKLALNEAYFKMFNSLDELKKYADTSITESTLKDNYVVLIESVFTIGGSEWEDLIGYYDFKYENGKYSISKDYSYSTGNKHMLELDAKYDYHLDYIVVPKSEIEFTEDVHKIEVNRIQRNKETFFYAKPSDKTPLPTEPTSFIVNREKAEQLGLKVSSYGSDDGYKGKVLILYMPDQIMSNLAITECKIENGNLYITIEKYDENAEDVIIPIGPNDVIFYEIYCDTSKLSESYQVFATINYTYLPTIHTEKIEHGIKITDFPGYENLPTTADQIEIYYQPAAEEFECVVENKEEIDILMDLILKSEYEYQGIYLAPGGRYKLILVYGDTKYVVNEFIRLSGNYYVNNNYALQEKIEEILSIEHN